MRAQDLHSEFLHRPTHCLLELFAYVTKVKCSRPTDLTIRWTLYHKFRRSQTSVNSEITDLVLELLVNLRSHRGDCWDSRVDQSLNVISL